jgi:hypothetical protein
MLLSSAACQNAPAGRDNPAENSKKESVVADESKAKAALQEGPKEESVVADESKTKPALQEGPKEESVVAYDSKTMGAIQVRVDQKDPVDSFDILQDGKRIGNGNRRLLNATVELAPGNYLIDVNRTQRKVTVEAGKKTTLWTGELVVEGKPSTMAWYAMKGKVKLTSTGVEPLLNRASPLFPGTYTVFVDTSLTGQDLSLGEAEVKAGQKTVLKR